MAVYQGESLPLLAPPLGGHSAFDAIFKLAPLLCKEVQHMNCDTIIKAGIIVTQNENRDVLHNASVAIGNGKILDIGHNLEKKWSAPVLLDQTSHIVMPGLINAHTHAAMTFLRGLADDVPLLNWLQETVFPLEARLTPDIVRLGSLLGYAEMLASGVTACIDMYIFEDAVFEAANEAGIRCLGGEAIFDFPSAASPNWRAALESTLALAEKYKGNDRLKVAINPHSVYTTTAEILQACRKAAAEHDLPVHIHLAETESETSLCQKSHNCRPVAWLERNGLFEGKLLGAHMVDINKQEIEFLANRNVVAIHNPVSNMKLASGGAPVSEMLAKGLNVALGTDGAASNNSLNLFTEMKLAALVQKYRMNDPATLTASTALDMATIAGALAFGDSELGSLKPGNKADCIALSLKRPNMQPLHEPIAQLVYAANGSECEMTMIGGEILYRNGGFSRFDIESLFAEVDKLQKFARNKCKAPC